MRGIQFRVRNLDTNKVIGYEFLTDQYHKGYHWHKIYIDNEDIGDDVFKENNLNREQYIGLDDENNTLIYEGDIVSINNNEIIAEVIYNSESTAFILKVIKGNIACKKIIFNAAFINNIEVIGNIYENKKLLEE